MKTVYCVVNKAGNKIFVSDFGNHSITCMSTDGNVDFQYTSFYILKTVYCVVNKAGNKIFVSDFGNHSITCMSTDGNVDFQYTYNRIIEAILLRTHKIPSC